MGWTDTVKKFFSRDTTGKVSELARGSSGENIMPQMGPGAPNSGMGGAYQQLSTMLSVDADLMLRYSDYENMDDYPEISCLTRDCKVAILDVPKNSTPGGDMAIAGIKWKSLGSLAARREQYPDEPLYVLAIDHARRKIVPARARGPVQTGSNVPVLKVTFEEHRSSPGNEKRRWIIRCTPEHLFMLRAGHYVPAQALKAGDRLMPCSDGVGKNGYLRVRDPFFVDAHRSTIYHNIHTLVAEELMLGGPVPVGHVVHHIDEDKTNAHPANLVVESRAAHTKIHEIVQRPEIRARIAAKITDRWADPVKKLQMSNAISAGKQRASAVRAPSTSLSGNPDPKGILSDEHRQKIAEAHTIPLAADVVRAAVQTSHSISEAARKLHVDDSTLARRMSKMGITRSELGQCVQTIHEGEAAYANHVVVSVEPDGYDDVYDIEVPEYHNFACEGVFVHNSALDIYADDATIIDAVHGRVIWATSKDKIVRDIINDLLHRRIRIEEDIWVAIRTMGKYGNIFCEVIVNEKGVLGLNWLPPPTMRRIIDGRGNLVGFVQDPSGMFAFNIATRDDLEKLRVKRDGSSAVFFYPWEVVHWRLRGKQMRALYGYSLLDSARWIWKRLIMLEDSSLVCKLTKSPSRFAFYVDTGEMPPREARAMVDEVRRRYKKKRIVDPSTGKLDFRINPIAQDEDIFIPTRAGKEASRVEVLSGPDYDDTNVLGYFLKKLYAAIRIPPQYLGGTETTNRAALTQEDVQFARLELRIQHEFVSGLSQVVRVHLAALNIDPDSVQWDLRMPAPSSIFEMQQIEVWNARAALAAALRDFFTMPWIVANIFHMSEEDALFATEAKKNEDEATAMAQAQVQAEIMQKFPELGPMGAMGAMGVPPEGEQGQAGAYEDVRKEIRRVLAENSGSNNEVLRLLNRIEPALNRVERRVRGTKTGS